MSRFKLFFLFVAAVSCTTQVFGDLVRWDFVGTVGISHSSVGQPVDAAGTSVTGSITFDNATPDILFFDPNVGIYENAVTGLEVQIGSDVYSADSDAGITTNPSPPGNQLVFDGGSDQNLFNTSDSLYGVDLHDFDLRIMDFSGLNPFLSDDTLPLSPPDVTNLYAALYMNGFEGSDTSFVEILIDSMTLGAVTSSASAVPEPNAFAMTLLGLLGLGSMIKRRAV